MTEDLVTQLSLRMAEMEHELERLARVYDGENSLSPGVVGILRRHTDKFSAVDVRLGDVERTVDRMRWTVAGAAAAGSLMGGGFVFLLSQWFSQIG